MIRMQCLHQDRFSSQSPGRWPGTKLTTGLLSESDEAEAHRECAAQAPDHPESSSPVFLPMAHAKLALSMGIRNWSGCGFSSMRLILPLDLPGVMSGVGYRPVKADAVGPQVCLTFVSKMTGQAAQCSGSAALDFIPHAARGQFIGWILLSTMVVRIVV